MSLQIFTSKMSEGGINFLKTGKRGYRVLAQAEKYPDPNGRKKSASCSQLNLPFYLRRRFSIHAHRHYGTV